MKKKYYFYIEVAVFTFLLYAISLCVFLNGDDFMYATFAKTGIFKSVFDYYFTGNGRFVINILDSLMLSCDRYIFIAVNPIIVLLFLYGIASNIQYLKYKTMNTENVCRYFKYSMVMFASIGVLCLRETVFWITGMMNYLFPAMLMLLAFLQFQKIVYENRKSSVLKIVFYLVLCLVTSATVEQFSLMFVGLQTLFIISLKVQKKSVPWYIYIGYVLSLVGLSFIILAPGNFVRVDDQSGTAPPFLDNLWTLIWQNTFSSTSFPIFLMLLMCSSYLCCKSLKSKFLRIFSCAVPIVSLIVSSVQALQITIILIPIIICIIAEFVYVFVVRKYNQKQVVLILFVIGLGSQIMLLVSEIWGFRCMFSMYTIYMLIIGICLTDLSKKNALIILGSGILNCILPILVPIYWVLSLAVCKLNDEYKRLIHIAVISLSVLFSLSTLLYGYASNVSTYEKNISSVKTNTAVVEVQKPPKDEYCWFKVPMEEFHEEYYKKYYNLQNETSFIYKSVDGNIIEE